MSRFFINRPVFAWVIAIAMMLFGCIAIRNLAVAQYPKIAPTQVSIRANYPGASAQTVQDTVTQVMEQSLVGLTRLLYFSSTSESTGQSRIEVTFEADLDPDIAQVQVQNKLESAKAMLPETVQKLGITVQKTAANFLMVISFISENGSMTNHDLSDYLVSSIQEPLCRLEGVGEVEVFGGAYAMRIWLDPNKLYKYNLVPGDVVAAIKEQNVQVAAGSLGGLPAVPNTQFSATVTAQSYLRTPEEFENILVKTDETGAAVRIRDVGRAELGSQNYIAHALYNGKPASGVAIKMAAGANALETQARVMAKLEELSKYYPVGMTHKIAYDTTPFVRLSIEKVLRTLMEAIVLVVAVMFVFLQNWRATLIPTIAVPVVLLGTFGIMWVTGFTINVLTMFALVLAIGLLVDDAIVVVENVERIMQSEKMSPKDATIASMSEITGALIGIALVLSAVFLPMACFGGTTGTIYRQFALTLASAMGLSVVVALTLTPALCVQFLKPHRHGVNRYYGFFGPFNRGFDALVGFCYKLAGLVSARPLRNLVVYACLLGGIGWGFVRLPTAFMPEEDQGAVMMLMTMPQGATESRADVVMDRVRNYIMEKEKDVVKSIFTLTGYSFAGAGQTVGMGFIDLKHWDERGRKETSGAVANRTIPYVMSFQDAFVITFIPPPCPDLGIADGFDFYLQDRAGLGHDKLVEAQNKLLQMANADPRLQLVRHNGMDDQSEAYIKLDADKARALGVSIAAVNDLISTNLGSNYVNDFINRERVKRVYVQADAPFRMTKEDILKWFVRGNNGQMVPLSAIATLEWRYGSPRLERFNGLPAINIQGAPAPGVSSGQAMQAIEDLIPQLGDGFSIEWSGVSYQEKIANEQGPILYVAALVVVFLCLAALYESWTIPFAVLFVIPTGIIGAIYSTYLWEMTNNIYFQVGLLTTIGLVSKNAILIVEFARSTYDKGKSLVEAAQIAVALRLRPILMTSLAFGLGVVPLVTAFGASSGAQNAIGVAVLGGVVTGTILCVFFTPMFFVLVNKVFGIKRHKEAEREDPRLAEAKRRMAEYHAEAAIKDAEIAAAEAKAAVEATAAGDGACAPDSEPKNSDPQEKK